MAINDSQFSNEKPYATKKGTRHLERAAICQALHRSGEGEGINLQRKENESQFYSQNFSQVPLLKASQSAPKALKQINVDDSFNKVDATYPTSPTKTTRGIVSQLRNDIKNPHNRDCGCFTCNQANTSRNSIQSSVFAYPRWTEPSQRRLKESQSTTTVLQLALHNSDSDSEEETVGSRVRTQNTGTRSRRTGYALRSGDTSGGRGLRNSPYVEPKERGMWDGKRRPGKYLPGTKQTVLNKTPSKDTAGKTVYQCKRCQKYFEEKDITLDHNPDWKTVIHKRAESEDDGRITSEQAQIAYSHTDDLVAMCQPCNSSKNGPRNIYD